MDDNPTSPSSSIPGDMPSLNMGGSAGTEPTAPVTSDLPLPPPAPAAPLEPALGEAPPPPPSGEPGGETPAPPPAADWGMGGVSLQPDVPPVAESVPVAPDSSVPSFAPLQPEPAPQGGELPPVAPPENGSTPVTTTTEETLVVPPAGSAASNPFIPQGTEQAGAVAPPKGGSLPKRMLTIVVVLLVLVGLGVGGFFGFKYFTASKEITLTYWGLWENNTTTATMLTDFQTKNPNIKVQYVKQSPRQYRERLQAAIARGEGPDVFEFHNTWVPMLRNELSPAPPTITTPADFTTTFYPVASADLVGGSSVYGIPMMIDGLGLYYNVDLLNAAVVKPPTTWPEVLDVVPKLTVKTDTQIQKSAIALGTTGNVENFSDIVALMLMQNGAKLIAPTGKEAEDTLTFYRKFANPSDPVYTWSDAMDNSVYAFATGKVAMMIAPSWRVFEIKQINPSLNFKIAPVPQLPGNTVNWATYWVEGVSTKSKSPEAAWAFVKYLTSKETTTKLYAEEAKARLFGEPYARVDLGSTLAADPYVGAYIGEAPTAKSFPLASRTFDNGLNDKLIKYLEDAINAVGAGTAPTQALETAAQGFAQVLSSFGLSTPAAPATTP